jgi:hypothetical protein
MGDEVELNLVRDFKGSRDRDARMVPRVPTLSAFYGILIRMFFNDHPPPHFHARYGEFEATVGIERLDLIEGQLPPRALSLTLEWAMIHREELLEAWRLCRQKRPPAKIDPLL